MEERYIRRRVNVSTSVKGIKTWDCTVDSNYLSEEEILKESDSLVTQLEKRYPVKVE
jgi:hypothetical protein